MRVVLANKFLYPKGGAERAVLTLGAELARRGHAVHYFGMEHPDNAVAGPDVTLVQRRDYHRPGPGRWRDALGMIYSPAARRSFGRLLDRLRPDVVHLHNIYHQLTPSILDAARARGIPMVMTLHDYKLVCPRYDMLRHGRPCDACVEAGPVACLRYRCAGGGWWRSLLLASESALHRARGSYDAVRLLLAPSRFLQGVLLGAGFDAARIRHVPNFVPAPFPGGVPTHPRRCLYVGRLSAEKGVETLVRAASQVAGIELVVCGTGPLAPALAALAARAPAGRILLRGHLEPGALALELEAAGFACAPSEWFENAPFAVLEAMASGRAVLASRLGGLPELVDEGETGELLPPGDEPAWAGAIARAAGEPERMLRMGERARAVAAERYSLEAHVTRIEAIYREVVG